MWQVDTVGAEGWFPGSDEDGSNKDFDGTTDEALSRLRTLLTKHRGRRIRDVRYRVDVPAWTARQRSEAGVPPRSALHPLRGDRLDRTRAVVPGIHTPYVYESGPAFGATFQIHAEDYRLCSLNHIHAGRKIWIVIPPGGMAQAEDAFTSGKSSSSSKGRRKRCSQFMRHRAEFVFPDTLTRMAVPHAVVDQRAGETLVILPDAYHQGFSTGYTLAEAKNYADEAWDPRPGEGGYMPCDAASCNLPTAIPPYLMEMMGEDEDESARIDLCAWHEGAEAREAAADEQAGNDVPVKDAPVEDDAPGEQDAPSEDAPGEQDAPGEDAPGEDAPGEDAPDPYAWPDEVKRPRDESGDVDMPPAQRARLTA